MHDPVIECPQCHHTIKLTESLAAPLIADTRKLFQAELAKKDADIAQREAHIRSEQKKLDAAKQAIDEQVAEQLREARQAIAKEEAEKAALRSAGEMAHQQQKQKELEAILEENTKKLHDAQKAQAEFLKRERDLADATRELELTIEKRVSASSSDIRNKALQAAREENELKMREKEEQLLSMQRKIEELKKKSEQGSQQLQGEVLEMKLEEELRKHFIYDQITPVPKGQHGGDVLQQVADVSGLQAGGILWETKRTKNWEERWLAKLRDDQRSAKAVIAIMVSQTLPAHVEHFAQRDGVWICSPHFAIPLALILRQGLLEVAHAKQAHIGQHTKMELVYAYLTGSQFKQRIEAIVEKFEDMQQDLAKERAFMQKNWAKREAQMHSVIQSTVGMYGDVQGIAGKALQEIAWFDTLALEDEQKRSA
jgi:hypothetical protein